ncbi:MAG: NTP transferase domain-containing protein [Elusimicrobia bacterium]|nr:NTP transferase domain-containing protein [Elusimicrobiota bacterium]
METLSAVVLAGGPKHRSTGAPRSLIPVHGVPLLSWALSLVEKLQPASITVVAGDGAELIEDCAHGRARVLEQKELYGSGHAVGLALESLGRPSGGLLVTYADRIFLKEETLRLLAGASRGGASASLLSVYLERPAGYARIVRDEDGRVIRGSGDCELVRPEDATIREVVAGAYWFDAAALAKALIPPRDLDRKYNLTECIQPLVAAGGKVLAIPLPDPAEAFGVYSMEDARAAELRLAPPAAVSSGAQSTGRAPSVISVPRIPGPSKLPMPSSS